MCERQRTWCRRFLGLWFCIFALIFPALSMGQEFPTRPIQLLIGFVPGGALKKYLEDADARAQKLGQDLKIQPQAEAK